MANLRAIRTRIKSVENTRQITKSMKMVAAAKLRRTQSAYLSLRDFAACGARMLARARGGKEDLNEVFLQPREKPEKRCYVLIVGNRGLCGTYNSALLRYLEEQAREDGREAFLVVCGRWGKEQIPELGLPVRESFEISDAPEAAEARQVADCLRELYRSGEADEVVLVYQRFKSVLQQSPGMQTLLPLASEEQPDEEVRWIFEPDRQTLLHALTEMVIDNTVHAALLEARTGEHSARMTAMTAASDNTEELIGELTLQLNHARQAAITTEISEIAGGAAALRNMQ